MIETIENFNSALTQTIKEGDKFYWATNGGVSEHILDHFEFFPYKDEIKGDIIRIHVYEKSKYDNIIFIGVAYSDAFGKYIFLNERKAKRAAKKFMRQAKKREKKEKKRFLS